MSIRAKQALVILASIAVAVPLVVALVWWSLRQLHHRVMGRGPDA